MSLKVIRGAAAGLLLAALSFASAGVALAAPLAADTGQDIKQAARALVASRYTNFAIDHVEIRAWVPNYALAVVYPNMQVNPTDPGTVILRNESDTWVGIGGPGTAFPPGESREGAPDELFDYANPYTGVNAENALNRLNVERVPFGRGPVRFQYPGDASVSQDGTIRVLGPEVNEPLPGGGGVFAGRAYEIEVNPLNERTNGPLDEWGYDRTLEELRRRVEAAGPGGRVAPPQFATYFHIPNADVFQIDWIGGDSIMRQFFVTPPGGGQVVEVQTRVYPIENNPAQPRAESAVSLLLHTLQQANGGTTPGMPRTGEGTGDPLLAIVAVAGLAILLVGLVMLQIRRQEERS